jgi:hypothetical protein
MLPVTPNLFASYLELERQIDKVAEDGWIWTPERRVAAEDYLVHKMSDDEYTALLDELRARQLDEGVNSVPSLEKLISALPPGRSQYPEVGWWLWTHATHGERVPLLQRLAPDKSARFGRWDEMDFAHGLTAHHSLPEIAQAWKVVTQPATPTERRIVHMNSVRAWAKENGYDIKERGRVPADVLTKYKAVTGQ